MRRYDVHILEQASEDMQGLSDAIMYEFKAPQTAFLYIQGLLDVIQSLSMSASCFQLQTAPLLIAKYGPFVRRVNYKKMAVLYTIHNQTVFIRRVVPQSTIGEL